MKQAKFPVEIIVYSRRIPFGGTTIYHVVEGGVTSLPVDLSGSEVGIYHLTTTATFEVEKRFKS
jgi:hypothetical protein